MIAANYPVRVLITVFSSVVALTAISEAAPVVNSTIPASGATNVAINIPIIAIFSEPMDGTTITYSTFRLEKLVPGTMTFNLTKTGQPTETYTSTYTTEPFAGIYSGTYGGSMSGNFYTGVTGDRSIGGISYSSSTDEYFFTSILDVNPTTWSFNAYTSESTHFWGNLTAAATSGNWYNSGYSGTFSGSKLLGNNGSPGYNKTVYTNSNYYSWIAAGEVSGSTIKGYVVDLYEPDVYYGTGTVAADNSFSIPNIYSGHYGNKVASATGTLNPAGEYVAGLVSYDASSQSGNFSPSDNLVANSTYRATVTGTVANASGTPMGTDKVWTFTTGTSIAKNLSVAISGSGEGGVTSTPSGIDCSYSPQSGFCSAYFTSSPVSLAAAADPGSLFTGWGGDCSGCSTTPCSVTLSSVTSCTAGFALIMVKIDGSPSAGFATLQKAYDAAGNNALLMARSGTLPENVVLNDDKPVRISGGYDSDFTSPTGVTTIDGSLTIARGELITEDLVIM